MLYWPCNHHCNYMEFFQLAEHTEKLDSSNCSNFLPNHHIDIYYSPCWLGRCRSVNPHHNTAFVVICLWLRFPVAVVNLKSVEGCKIALTLSHSFGPF